MKNLIYVDTEFTNFVKPSLISLGAVSSSGDKFYVEITDYPKHLQSDFVSKVVVPLLDPQKYGEKFTSAGARFSEWLATQGDFVICCDYEEDFRLAVDLLGEDHYKPNFIHLNILLFNLLNKAYNSAPDSYTFTKRVKDYFDNIEEYFTINKLARHHALYDALAMKYSVDKIALDLTIPS